jgi:hypothetical protein
MLKQRLPIRLVTAAGCLLMTGLSASSAQDVYKVRTLPAQKPVPPVDPAADAMRREAQARAMEHAAHFARLKAIDPDRVAAVQQLAVDLQLAERARVIAQVQVPNAAQVQQMTAHFRPILKAEYHLLVAACEPTRDQRREIARAGEKALRASVEAFVDWQRQPNRRILNGVEVPNPPDVRKAIQIALAAAVAAHLSPPQMVRYFEEVKERNDDERETIVLNIVVKLDERLHFTEDQRAALSKALTKGWSDDWAPSLNNVVIQNRHFPILPDDAIRPILTEGQKRTWDGAHKSRQNARVGYTNGMTPDPSPLEDAELDDDSKTKPNNR